jgi:PTH1 family peptidyl-tRNA hydrolase
MNLSGHAVRLLSNVYVESLSDLIVVYDDIDLPVGKLRIRQNGSAGTHNGMRSIVEELASEQFPRLRIGIGAPDGVKLRDHVLDEFDAGEQPIVDRAVTRAVDALVLFVRGDIKRAMNQFNKEEKEETPSADKP